MHQVADDDAESLMQQIAADDDDESLMQQIVADDASSQSGMMQIAVGDGESSIGADAMANMGITSQAPNLKEHASDDTELTLKTETLTASEMSKKNNHMSAQNKTSAGGFAFGGMRAGEAGNDDLSDSGDLDNQMKMGDNDSESAMSGMMQIGAGGDDDGESGVMQIDNANDDAVSGVMAMDEDDG